MEVMLVTSFKNERIDKRSYKFTFTDKDMVGVDTPIMMPLYYQSILACLR